MKIKYSTLLLVSLTIISIITSCRSDFEFEKSTGQLSFSKDTVYLDTIFSNISSSTYKLKVYNKSNKDIYIPKIELENGENSKFRISVDGLTGDNGKSFNNIEILAKDSLFVLVESTVNISDVSLESEFLYTDRILFDNENNLQDVDLVTLVKDAVFIYPNRSLDTDDNGNSIYIKETLSFDVDGDGEIDETTLEGRLLSDDELNFTNAKPYIIYGYAGVPSNKTLTIDKGARIHFHSNSGIIVTENASIKVNGELSTDPEKQENEVIFESDRLEPSFAEVPGQWGTIILYNDSKENIFNYATIKNAQVGLFVIGNPDETIQKLTINNSKIFNCSDYGLLARQTSIYGENTVINNCGLISLAVTLGGSYDFKHCTFANYWNNSYRQTPTVLLNNYMVIDQENVLVSELTKANFSNSIIYGSNNIEFIVEEIESDSNFNFFLEDCLIKFDDYNKDFVNNPYYNFFNTLYYKSITKDEAPLFINTSLNKLGINEGSPAINKGNLSTAGDVPNDINGIDRTSAPDLGAYQHQIEK